MIIFDFVMDLYHAWCWSTCYSANLAKANTAKNKEDRKVGKGSIMMIIFDIQVVTDIYNTVIHPSDWSLIAPDDCKPFSSSSYQNALLNLILGTSDSDARLISFIEKIPFKLFQVGDF